MTEQIEVLPAAKRDVFLLQFEADPSIRTEVIGLLTGLENEPRASMPSRIAPYKITGILGQGGLGIVYAAEIGDQLVALKLIQTHLHDAGHLSRFAREQNILAKLNHPGITKRIDAGI